MKPIYLILTLLFVTGCSQTPGTNDNSIWNEEVNIGELFQLQIGDSAVITNANIEITLRDAHDSRCPESVKCVSAGNFNANVILRNLNTEEVEEKQFFAGTDAYFDYTVFNGFIVRPVEWKSGRRVNSSYEITFVVERGIAFEQQFIMKFGETVPIGNGNIKLSLDNIVVKNNEKSDSEGRKSEAILYFGISNGSEQYSSHVKYLPRRDDLHTELGGYQIFLQDLVGMQPYYHYFNIYKDEIINPTRYRAQIFVVQT